MLQNIEVDDIVLVPCKVIGKGNKLFSNEELLDCVLLGTDKTGLDYNRKPIKFTVFKDDVVKSYKQGKGVL